jgi:CO/xanthine dehydrogenase Mo-binding subunit
MKHRGRGMACGWYGIARTAAMDRAAVWVELDDGGTVKVATGVTEIGEGVLTGLCQIAAQEMGVRPEDIVLGDNDTARVPEAAHAGATRMTYMIGNAVAIACREAFGKFRAAMGAYWGVSAESVRAFAGEVWVEGSASKRMTMEHAVHVLKKERGIVIVGSGLFTSAGTRRCTPTRARPRPGKAMSSARRSPRSKSTTTPAKCRCWGCGPLTMSAAWSTRSRSKARSKVPW